MKNQSGGKGLNVTMLVIGLFFLTMGLTDLGKDPFGVLLGLSVGLPLLGLYVWRKLRSARGKPVKAGAVCVLLFILALFFLSMGFTGLVRERSMAIMGFSLGLPLAALYVFRRRTELRAAEEAEAETWTGADLPVVVRQPVREAPAAVRQPVRTEEAPLSLCPHCGAPSKEKICPYCGMAK